MYPILKYKKGKLWELYEPFTKGIYTVPKGFVYDLASIPRIFWPVLAPFGRWLPATTIHDYLYQSKIVNRKQADKVMFELLIEDKVNIALSLIMYLSVRIFGKNRYIKE
jgi:hypothetical protein